MLMEGPREPSELVVIHHQKWCCGRLTLNLTKVCPWSLPSTTNLAVLKWSLVSALLCATLCTHSHQKWPRSSWSERGGKIEDLMVLLRNRPQK